MVFGIEVGGCMCIGNNEENKIVDQQFMELLTNEECEIFMNFRF